MNRTLWPATFEFLLGTASAAGVVDAVDDDDRGLARQLVPGLGAGGALPAGVAASGPSPTVCSRWLAAPTTTPSERRARPAGRGAPRTRRRLEGLAQRGCRLLLPRGGIFGEEPPTPAEEALRLAAVSKPVPHPTTPACAPPSTSSPPSKRRGTRASPRWNGCSRAPTTTSTTRSTS